MKGDVSSFTDEVGHWSLCEWKVTEFTESYRVLGSKEMKMNEEG